MTTADELRTAAKAERTGWGGLKGRIPPQVAVHLALAELLDQIAWSWDLDPALEHRHGGPEILLVARAINECVRVYEVAGLQYGPAHVNPGRDADN